MSDPRKPRLGSRAGIDDFLKRSNGVLDRLFPEPSSDDQRQMFASDIVIEPDLQERVFDVRQDVVSRINDSCVLDELDERDSTFAGHDALGIPRPLAGFSRASAGAALVTIGLALRRRYGIPEEGRAELPSQRIESIIGSLALSSLVDFGAFSAPHTDPPEPVRRGPYTV